MGHELDGDVTPVEAGLDFATRKIGGFIGAEALAARRAKGPSSQVVSLILDDENAVPLGHEPIYLDGKIIGKTTSAAFGYRVGKPIALGYAKGKIENGARVKVDVARQLFDATVSIGPLYDANSERMKG